MTAPLRTVAPVTWDDFGRELDAWRAGGRTATFWWRDDDAVAPTPALDRLLSLRDRADAPLSLAVIPARAAEPLAERLAQAASVTVLQHGSAHRNHAPAGAKKTELGPHRPVSTMAAELAAGRGRLAALFAARFRPVLVPPWNRIDPGLAGVLPDLGYAGLSTFGAPRPSLPAGLVQANTHADVVDWRGSRGFAGGAAVLAALTGHLGERRRGWPDDGAPTGLLTHHLVLDEAAWNFLGLLLDRIGAHPGARWAGADEAFEAR